MHMTGVVGAVWGIAGVLLLLVFAIVRLTFVTIEAFSYDLRWDHWLALGINIVFMAYSEGYRGFQKSFSPRVASRARYLLGHPTALHAILGPFFCIGYFHASRRRKVSAISLTLGIFCLVYLVRLVEQPWRGIIDAGVVVGLAWGVISLVVFCIQAFTSERFDYPPEVPE